MASGALRCADIGPAARGSVSIDGARATYGPISGMWEASVVLRNGTADVLGSRDGVSPDADGIEVRVLDMPTVTRGSGAVRLAAHSDVALRIETMLAPGAGAEPVQWRFRVPASVEAFSFRVGVYAAAAPLPRGWVALTSTATSAFPGGSYGLAATARSARGVALPGGVLSWSSSAPSLVSVDASGVVTPVEPGVATITARSGAAMSSVDLAVCPQLAVGQVHHFVVAGTSGFCLSGGTGAAAEYTIVPINESTGGASTSLSIVGTGIQAATGPPTPSAHQHDGADLPDGLRLGGEVVEDAHLTPEGIAAQEALNRELERLLPDRRSRVSSEARPRRYGTRAISPGPRRTGDRRVPGGRRDPLSQPIPQGVVPAIGDTMYLNVAAGCTGTTDIRKGVVRAVTSNFILVFDKDNPAFTPNTASGNPFTPDTLAARYERLGVHDEMASTFGTPTDLDGNGRSVVFYTRAVNELSPPASSVVTLGYFTARDLFDSDPVQGCARSNEGEIFYMLVPDPAGTVNSNVRTEAFVMGATIGTAAHEMQHLINASRRVYVNGASTYEEVWLNEALSAIGEERMFYRHSVGLAPGGNIVVSQLTTGPNASRRVAAFNTYANSNFGRLRSFLQRPDTTGVFRMHDGLAVRGGGWGFLRYAIDRKGGTQAATTLALSGNAVAAGKETLRQALGLASTAEVDAWYRDWLVAMYADDAVAGIETTYTNPSWNYRSLYTALNGSYQLVPRPLANGTPLTLSYKSRGATAWVRVGVAADGFARITSTSGGGTPPSTMRMSVIRTK